MLSHWVLRSKLGNLTASTQSGHASRTQIALRFTMSVAYGF